jgi:stage IV sporulation protein FA
MDIDLIRKQIKEKRKNLYFTKAKETISHNPKIFSYVIKVMILSIIFLGSLIYTKASANNKQLFYDIVFKNNLSFAVINNFYNKNLGGILPFKDIIKDNKPVFKEKLVFNESNIYKDGVALSVSKSYLVPVLNSGIVVFIGEKEDYGKTVIIQQVNGVDVWYGNVDNLNVKIYDYIEGGSLLGEVISDKLYLVFKQDGKVIDYKEHLQ